MSELVKQGEWDFTPITYDINDLDLSRLPSTPLELIRSLDAYDKFLHEMLWRFPRRRRFQ